MASRLLSDLTPELSKLATLFLAKCRAAGIDVLIYCTYRSPEEQDELYAQGRTKPGKIVTNAKAGQSKHNVRKAFDCVPMLNGKPIWDNSDPVWQKIGEIGESCGLKWAGRWKSFREFPHFEID